MKDKIKWPAGNRLDLCIPLRKITVTEEGTQFGEYIPSQAAVVMVYFVGNYASYEYTPRIEDNKLFITDNGELKPGVYAIDVRIQEPERKLRSFRCGELEIVRETKQLALGDFVLNNNVTLDADAFIFGEGPSAFEEAVRDGYTGTKAEWLESLRGKEGRGIADIVSLPTGAFRILLTDGSAYVTPILKGEQGVSIVDFTVSSITSQEVLCTVTMSDGTTRQLNLPRGEQGAKGDKGDDGQDGRGIQSIVLNADYTLTFNYTDGTTYTTPQSLRGEKGENGQDGQDGRGISSMSLDNDNHLTVSYTDGTTYTTPQSLQGERGVGITDFEQVGENATMCFFNIFYSNGNISQIGLPKGEQGDRGEQGPQGPKGDTVVLGEVGEYKLYNTGGTATDGAMTQDATTKAIAANTGYYECGTAAGTAAKVAVGDNEALYTLQKCGSIKVKMTNANAAASGVTLKIGSAAATPLYYNGAAVSSSNTWEAGEVVEVYYDGTNYQATNAQGGGGKAEKIKYNNSASGLNADNVQNSIDELNNRTINYETVDFTGQTTKLYYYINGSTGIWAEYNKNAKYVCRIVPISANTKYRITAADNNPAMYALLDNNSPASHVGEVATDWNNGKPKAISAGESIVIDSGEYTFLYVRNNINSASTDIKYPKRIEKQVELKTTVEEIIQDIETLTLNTEENKKQILDVESRLYPYLDNVPEVNYAFSIDVFGTSTSYKHAAIPVSAGEEYIIEAPSGVNTFYCFATSNAATSGGAIPFIEGVTSATFVGTGKKVKVAIPDTCTYLLVYNNSNARPFLVKKTSILKKVQVKLSYDYITAGGDFGQYQSDFESGQFLATTRFIKISDPFICKFNHDGRLRVFYYDSEFNRVGYENYPHDTEPLSPAIEANTDIFVNENGFKYSYVKFLFDTETPFNNGKPLEVEAEVRGNLDDNWDVFNVRTSTYHRICVMVNVSDARCSDGITSQIQDSIDLRPNYGVIALPNTYSNTGKPTRLIIYCHGAGTHFTFSNATGFNTSEHVNPNYWLKEGYAVMDIDGNPMNSDAHSFRPQAMNAYIAAYKWAIEHYNLCRDGVLLGGRSMGAGTTMYLLRSTCPIPVIAACANLPTSVAMNKTASAKLSIANMRGFIIPDGFTFSDGVMNNSDTQVYYDNWEKAIRYIPSIALCVDTPTTEEWKKNFIKNCCHVGNPYEANRIAACKDLHMIIRAPLKMFGCFEDPNNGYQATAQLYMTMLGNAGQQAEYRLFHSDKATNYPSDSRSEHYYELADPTLRTTVTTVHGEEVTNAPIVYVEMLQFWRRYEQNI